jgi:uncharacterized C2H2 Zn-finger protein
MIYTCEKCKKSFENKTHFTTHINKKFACDIPVIYTCDKCNKTFHNKTDYTRHMNRKNICNKLEDNNVTNSNNEINDTINNESLKVINNESLKVINNESLKVINNESLKVINNESLKENKNELIKIDDTKLIKVDEYKCEDCNKIYTTKRSLKRHLREYCKIGEKNELYEIIQQMQNQIDNIKSNNQTNIVGNNNNMNSNNTTNNVNNTNNTIVNNININAYGKEDISHISDNEYKNIFTKFNSMIPMLIELIHFNEDKPENKNVYISNMRSKHAYMYDGNKWILRNKNELIDDLYDKKCIIIIEKYEDLKNALNNNIVRNLDRFVDKYDEEHVKNGILDRIELLLYNNRKIVDK